MVIRTWNLFHGNSSPCGRRSYVEQMVRLASADGPGLLLLQEVPVWALAQLGTWSGMTAVTDVAQRPRLGPMPISAALGQRLTSLHPGVLRSAFSGQGNATLLAPGLRSADRRILTLNPPDIRREEARRLRLDLVARLAWAKERRICQLVRVEREEGPPLVVANLHATSFPGDPRIPEAELRRAAAWIDSTARTGDVVVVGGDFNVEPHTGAFLEGYSEPGSWVDHLLVRGVEPAGLRVWPDERRRLEGILLSDHPPVELEIP